MTDEITLDAPETPLERFLAAAAGMDGITLDKPVTRIEKYLYKIAQGSGGVPAVEDADKGKYLHANESTGDIEWAEAGGSGGGAVVHAVINENTLTLDKTWQEIFDGDYSSVSVLTAESNKILGRIVQVSNEFTSYYVEAMLGDGDDPLSCTTDSADGYPSATIG